MATSLRPSSGVSVRRFRPILNFGYQQELLSVVAKLEGCAGNDRIQLLDDAIKAVDHRERLLIGEGVPASALFPTVAYATSLRLLRDLLAQGWSAGVDDEGVFLLPPDVARIRGDSATAKSLLRSSFSFARLAQLAEPATARFIRSMEKRGIARLFETGEELAKRLGQADVAGSLEAAIRPVLVGVTPESVDDLTGIRLQDVWRYARHLWSIPYQSSPGRNMFYVVRDGASSNRPVLGIAALGNAVLGLSQRDDALGWSVRALQGRLLASPSSERLEIARRLEATLVSAIDDVFVDDFDLSKPYGPLTLSRLAAIEDRANRRRMRALEEAADERTAEYHFVRMSHAAIEAGELASVDWKALATTDLYTRKRANVLHTLVRASLTFRERALTTEPDALLVGLENDEVRRAADVALRQQKIRAIAQNVMEIITCGVEL